MNTSLILSEMEQCRQNNAKILTLEENLDHIDFPFIHRGMLEDWHFSLDGNRPDKKYVLAMAECMDDRNTHNPLIFLLSLIQNHNIPIQTLDAKLLKTLEIFAPKMLNKIAGAGPFTLRDIPREYLHALSKLYEDHIVVMPITAHLECGAHGKNNLQAVLRRLQITGEIYDYHLPNLIPIPMISFTNEDHRLMVLDSYEEVLDLVSKFADKSEDLDELQTMFLRYEQVLRVNEELNHEAKFVTELLGNILENDKSAYVARFLELDDGAIRTHATKYIHSNIETIGLAQYLLNPDLPRTEYQHFETDVIDVSHEDRFDQLLREIEVALHYTNEHDQGTDPTRWHINIRSDNPNKQLFLDRLRQEFGNTNNPAAQNVKADIMSGKIIPFMNEFDHRNRLLTSEVIEVL